MVEEIEIAKIKVEDRFRKDMGDLESLAEAIKEKGLIQPITVDQNFKLIAGERRLEAHKLLGLTKIRAIRRESRDKIDHHEIELMENVARKDMTWPELCQLEKRIWELKAKKGNWTQAKQAEMLNQSPMQTNRRLQMAEALEVLPDLENHENFDSAWKDLKSLEERATVKALEAKVKATPEIVKAREFADQHYIVGDAIQGLRDTPDRTAHFAEVDPPYAVDLDQRKSRSKNKGHMGDYNELDADEYVPFLRNIAEEVYRVLMPETFAVFWYGMSWHTQTLATLRDVGFKVPDIPAIWYKNEAGQTASPDTTLGSCYEPFFVVRKGKPKMPKSGRSNVFHFAPVPPTRKIHPTQKPLPLMLELYKTLVWPGSNIVIPFLGSGVALQAAYDLSHTGFGWDLSENNKERFMRMMREAAGKETADE